MQSIAEEIYSLTTGEAVTSGNLTLFPLFRSNAVPATPDYCLLDEAIAKGWAKVTEVGASGSVPELHFSNTGDRPVLLLDGEELIGAKQNRVINLTILAPAHQETVIPVSCVEAGRWHAQSPAFKSSDRLMYSRARAAKSEQVSFSMAESGVRQSDQMAVWQDIAAKSERLGALSPTLAMSEIYEKRAASINDYLRAFTWSEQQAGVIFAIGDFFGFDLFDHPATMRASFPKLMRSYALDAIDAAPCAAPARETALHFLRSVSAAQSQTTDAVGLGKDVRLAANGVSGAALWAEDRYIHLCSFTTDSTVSDPERKTRMSRPRRRAQQG